MSVPDRPSRLSGRLLLVLAVVLLCGGALHGIAGPFVAGHYGFHGGEYSTRARHTLRHGSILPANTPGWAAPVPSSLYLHHPILTHQVVTLTFGLFGEHPATVRLGSLLGCLSTMLALWWILLQRWGPLPAGLGAVAFALLPINVWFAPHMDVGYPSMVCALLCFERYLPWMERGRYRDLGLCLLWAALSVGFEWSPYLFAIPLGLHGVALALGRRGRYLLFPPLLCVAMLAPLALHGWAVLATNHLWEMQESFRSRTRVMQYREFLSSLYDYARQLYGAGAIKLLALWGALLVGRLLMGKIKRRDLLGAAFLFATVSYFHIFKQGVLMHPYRLLYGGVVFGVMAADFVVSADALLGRLSGGRTRPLVGGLVATALIGGVMLGPARAALRQSRLQAGTPTQVPVKHDPVLGKVAFAEYVRGATTPGDVVEIHPTFSCRMDLAFHLDRDGRVLAGLAALKTPVGPQAVYFGSYGPSQGPHPSPRRERSVVALMPRSVQGEERRLLGELLRQHPAVEVDGYMMIDLRQGAGPAQGVKVFRLGPPPRRVGLDAYLQGPYPLPSLVPNPQAEAAYRTEFKLD